MALMPGAVWRPVPVSASRPRRPKGRGVCLHVAVSEASSLFGYFSTATVDSHFYVAKSGIIEQYVDTDLVAYAQLEGNTTLISVETQGGVTDPDRELWTSAQVGSLAAIARWAAETEGVPLIAMPDSRPTSRGVGYHRLGIDPWRVAGGELWSSATGKVCPGAAKIAQVPRIITAAQSGIDTGGLTLADINTIQAALNEIITELRGPNRLGWPVARNNVPADQQPRLTMVQMLAGLDRELNSRMNLLGRPGPDTDTALGQQLSIRAETRGLAGRVARLEQPAVDASAVAAALASNPEFLAAIAKAVNDDIAARLRA